MKMSTIVYEIANCIELFENNGTLLTIDSKVEYSSIIQGTPCIIQLSIR